MYGKGIRKAVSRWPDELSGNLFNYYSNTYSLPECIDKLIAYGEAHEAQTHMMPSVPRQPITCMAMKKAAW